MSTVQIKERSFTKDQLISLYHLMSQHSDLENANKTLDLYEKLVSNELAVAFSGHFSAGKSSMINALFEKDILPNSPIPTSANIVKIISGGNTARIFFKKSPPIEYKAPYDFDMIKQYSTDKDAIKRIEININENILPENCAIIDTPGIDAANDADRFMTESALYLVDIMFYVMDYNHVQSEVNLNFLKTLQEKGIPVIIIINQIDKHNEEELTFQSFKDSFTDTLNKWGVQPQAIYYSSLYDESAIHNEFPKIKQQLTNIFAKHQNEKVNIDHSVDQLIADHLIFLQEELAEKSSDDHTELTFGSSDIEQAKNKLMKTSEQVKQFQLDFQQELNQTLNNAYLMPASLRDEAKLFLESQQKDFSLGIFSRKRKREAVKLERAQTFLSSLEKNIESSIIWRLKDRFSNLLKKYEIADQTASLSIQRLEMDYTIDHLIKLINHGATINGNFILNYTKDVSEDIKSMFKKQMNELLEKITTIFKKELAPKLAKYEIELNEMTEAYNIQQTHAKLQAEYNNKSTQVQLIKKQDEPIEEARESFQIALKSRKESIKQIDVKATPVEVKNLAETDSDEPMLKSVDNELTTSYTAETIVQKIEETITTIDALPSFQALIADLKDKQQRLTDRTLTISLFGAFSAGKSSFANSLIGAQVLPVSPNPTTATITRIAPVTKENRHGTVKIHLKSEQELVTDLIEITKEFSPSATNLNELLLWIKQEDIHQNELLNKMYQSYLTAMQLGFEDSQAVIGQSITISLDEFASYVTDEKKACYIESVDLYYACELTDQGITIVDTPGADSINARHTNVAFDSIKQTDAILYVTYYNHALSRADKDFLMQLGRVKDTFELDKMFFIINAADLAKDDQELRLVEEYVKNELLKLNIRLPRVYPVSSKESLIEKMENKQLNSKMQAFETSFYEFIHHDLASLMIESALLDIDRTYEAVTNYITTINLDEAEVNKFRIKLKSKYDQKNELLNKEDYTVYAEKISQRIDTQLHYVIQRLSIRFNDLFRDNFNPTTVSGSGRKAQDMLTHALHLLLEETAYELLQEVRAVSLRVEATARQLINDYYEQIKNKLRAIDQTFLLPTVDAFKFVSPQFAKAFPTLDTQLFNDDLKTYKGTKSFFVNNQRDEMMESIYMRLTPFIKQYVKKNDEIMSRSYKEQWDKAMLMVERQIQSSIKNHYEQHLAMTTDNINKEAILQAHNKLQTIIEAVHNKG